LDLGEGRYRQATAPWEGLANGFTLLFEAFLMELVRVMPVHQVCKMFGVTDHKVWSLVKKYTNLGREASYHSAVNTIGLDETATRLGHDHVTLFVDLATRRILYDTACKNSERISDFCTDFQAHKGVPSQIEQVSGDMSSAFIKGVEENLSEKQRRNFDDIKFTGLHFKTMKAYHILEAYQQIYKARTPRSSNNC